MSAANSKLYRGGVSPNGFVLMNPCLGVGLTENYTFGIIYVPTYWGNDKARSALDAKCQGDY